MEFFQKEMDGHHFTYLLENVEENFGVMNLDRQHTLVALFEPVNAVQPVKLDGQVQQEEVQRIFGLNTQQSRAFAKLLNKHIPNRGRAH